MEPFFILGFLAGAVTSAGCVFTALRALRGGSLRGLNWTFVATQLLGCVMYVIYLVQAGALAGAFWTFVSVVAFGIIIWKKTTERGDSND